MTGGKALLRKRRAPQISREDAETLCLLRLIGTGERSISEICRALALSASHEAALAQVFQEMTAQGELELIEDRVSLTDSGRERMEAIGAMLGSKPKVVRAKGKKLRPAGRSKSKKKRK